MDNLGVRRGTENRKDSEVSIRRPGETRIKCSKRDPGPIPTTPAASRSPRLQRLISSTATTRRGSNRRVPDTRANTRQPARFIRYLPYSDRPLAAPHPIFGIPRRRERQSAPASRGAEPIQRHLLPSTSLHAPCHRARDVSCRGSLPGLKVVYGSVFAANRASISPCR
jgi:hypothetical protein